MTAYSIHRPHPALGLDADDLGAIRALADRAAALRPYLRPALMLRLQLAAVLVAYLMAGAMIVGGLPLLAHAPLHEAALRILALGAT